MFKLAMAAIVLAAGISFSGQASDFHIGFSGGGHRGASHYRGGSHGGHHGGYHGGYHHGYHGGYHHAPRYYSAPRYVYQPTYYVAPRRYYAQPVYEYSTYSRDRHYCD